MNWLEHAAQQKSLSSATLPATMHTSLQVPFADARAEATCDSQVAGSLLPAAEWDSVEAMSWLEHAAQQKSLSSATLSAAMHTSLQSPFADAQTEATCDSQVAGSSLPDAEWDSVEESAEEVEVSIRPDRGSHVIGTCKPCKFFFRADSCALGNECTFCHELHPPGHPGMKWRPSKKRRQAFKMAVQEETSRILRASHSVTESGQIGGPRIERAEMPAWIAKNPILVQKVIGSATNATATPLCGVVYRL